MKSLLRRRNVLVAAALGLALLAVANAHLVRVAFESRPDCVPHDRDGSGARLGAAKSAC